MLKKIKKITLLISNYLNKDCKKFGITACQMEVLIFIEHQNKFGNNVKPTNLQEFLMIKKPSVTSLLNNLEKNDFVERKVDFNDARIKYITLTEKAKNMMAILKQKAENFESNLLSDLTENEIQIIDNLLEKLKNKITELELKENV